MHETSYYKSVGRYHVSNFESVKPGGELLANVPWSLMIYKIDRSSTNSTKAGITSLWMMNVISVDTWIGESYNVVFSWTAGASSRRGWGDMIVFSRGIAGMRLRTGCARADRESPHAQKKQTILTNVLALQARPLVLPDFSILKKLLACEAIHYCMVHHGSSGTACMHALWWRHVHIQEVYYQLIAYILTLYSVAHPRLRVSICSIQEHM